MTPITVPVTVLEALGGLHDDEPVVFCVHRHEHWHRWAWAQGETLPTHAQDELRPDVQLELPASAPALRRMLARHLGWTLADGEVPAWTNMGDGWALGGMGGCAPARFLVEYDKFSPLSTVVPTLADPNNKSFGVIQDPLRGLAAVLVHVAGEANAVRFLDALATP